MICILSNTASTLFFRDRKSTRLNSSHQIISYAVFCLKKKKTQHFGGALHLFGAYYYPCHIAQQRTALLTLNSATELHIIRRTTCVIENESMVRARSRR